MGSDFKAHGFTFGKASRTLHIGPAIMKAEEVSIQITEVTSKQSHPTTAGFSSLFVQSLFPPREIVASCKLTILLEKRASPPISLPLYPCIFMCQ